jgi:hypothetical protein
LKSRPDFDAGKNSSPALIRAVLVGAALGAAFAAGAFAVVAADVVAGGDAGSGVGVGALVVPALLQPEDTLAWTTRPARVPTARVSVAARTRRDGRWVEGVEGMSPWTGEGRS